MIAPPAHQEIDHRTIKLIVGIVALSLAPLTSNLAVSPLSSISASYYEGGWSQSIFVGFLFAIAALMLCYNGMNSWDMLLSKVASAAGAAVALFPCTCETHSHAFANVHALAATVLFLVLAYFCYVFFKRARVKPGKPAKARAGIYAVCGVVMLGSILVLALAGMSSSSGIGHIARVTFYGEAAGLTAFGVSWLTASRVLPGITSKAERFSPLAQTNPADVSNPQRS